MKKRTVALCVLAENLTHKLQLCLHLYLSGVSLKSVFVGNIVYIKKRGLVMIIVLEMHNHIDIT